MTHNLPGMKKLRQMLVVAASAGALSWLNHKILPLFRLFGELLEVVLKTVHCQGFCNRNAEWLEQLFGFQFMDRGMYQSAWIIAGDQIAVTPIQTKVFA